MPTLADAPTELVREVTADGHVFPRRPHWRRVLTALLHVPFANPGNATVRALLRNLDLPPTTKIAPGFECRLGKLYLGENVTLADTRFLDFAPVVIGDRTRFSLHNIVITSTHDEETFGKVITDPVVIGDDVWITTGVIILPGVRIGNGSVIAAGSVVTHDIPANVVAAGNPCRTIRPRSRGAATHPSAPPA
jgi:maltose O-acetyltransferase